MSTINRTRDENTNIFKVLVHELAEMYNDILDKTFDDELELLKTQKETFEYIVATISKEEFPDRHLEAERQLAEINDRIAAIEDERMNYKLAL